MANGDSGCSKCMFLELYGKPPALCGGKDRHFPCSFRKAFKEGYSCVQSGGALCFVHYPDYRKLFLQSPGFSHDPARKPELCPPLRLYYSCLLEDRGWLEEMGLFCAFAHIPELPGLRFYLGGHLSHLPDRVWILQVSRKKETVKETFKNPAVWKGPPFI